MSEDTYPIIYAARKSRNLVHAHWLKRLIGSGLIPAGSAEFSIHPSINLPGAKRSELDIVLHARFPNAFTRSLQISSTSAPAEVSFSSILAVIEVKQHRHINKGENSTVKLTPTQALVRYRDSLTGDLYWSDATEQNLAQCFALKELVALHFGWTPYVCNLLYFSRLHKAELPSGPNLYLASDSTFDEMLQKLCLARRLSAPATAHTLKFNCADTDQSEEIQLRDRQLLTLLGDHKWEPKPYRPGISAQWRPRSEPPGKPHPAITPAPGTGNSNTLPTSGLINPQARVKSRMRPAPKRASNSSREPQNYFETASKLAGDPPYPSSILQAQTGTRTLLRYSALAVMLIVCVFGFLLFAVRSSHRVSPETPRQSAVPDTQITLCSVNASGETCSPNHLLYPGQIVLLRFSAIDEKLTAARLTTPSGKLLPIPVKKLPMSQPGARYNFLAQYTLAKAATPGTYRIVTTIKNVPTGRQEISTQTFTVSR